mgnify:CR=1 FL=1
MYLKLVKKKKIEYKIIIEHTYSYYNSLRNHNCEKHSINLTHYYEAPVNKKTKKINKKRLFWNLFYSDILKLSNQV